MALVRYRQPIEEILKVQEAHRAYQRQLKADGILLAAGPWDPRFGGMFLVRVPDDNPRAALDQHPRQRSFLHRGRRPVRAPVLECCHRQRRVGQAVGRQFPVHSCQFKTGPQCQFQQCRRFELTTGNWKLTPSLLPLPQQLPQCPRHHHQGDDQEERDEERPSHGLGGGRAAAARVDGGHGDADDDHHDGADDVVPEELDCW